MIKFVDEPGNINYCLRTVFVSCTVIYACSLPFGEKDV